MKFAWSALAFVLLFTFASTASAQRHRAELDHLGSYNFTVEIEGINAGVYTYSGTIDGSVKFVDMADGSVKTVVNGTFSTDATKGLDEWIAKSGDQGVTVRMIISYDDGTTATVVELGATKIDKVVGMPGGIVTLTTYTSQRGPIDPKKVTRLALEA